MAKRRSGRERVATTYAAESTDEEEDDDPKTKKAKVKLKQMMTEDSDAESDFEKEMLDTKQSAHSGSGDDTDEETTERKGQSQPDEYMLKLSESDSSGEESPRKPREVKVASKACPSQALKSSYFGDCGEDSGDDGGEGSQKLLALVDNLEEVKKAWKEKPAKETGKSAKDDGKPPKKSKKMKVGGGSEISSLLALGEGEGSQEEVEEEGSASTSRECVEVTIAMPKHPQQRKRKKGLDVAAYIKKEMAKSRREVQEVVHKSHFTCLLAHLLHTDRLLCHPLLQATALSLLPTSLTTSPSQLTILGLGHLLSWLRGAVPVNKHSTNPGKGAKTKTSVDEEIAAMKSPRSVAALVRAMETLLAMDTAELVLVLVLVCRSLGYSTRLVTNLALLPLKPTESMGRVEEVKSTGKKVEEKRERKGEPSTSHQGKPSLSSKLAQSARGGRTGESGSGSKTNGSKTIGSKTSGSRDKSSKSRSGKGSRKEKVKSRRRSGSDEEGEEAVAPTPPQSKASLSSKLAAAARSRVSATVTAPRGQERGDREEEMVRRLEEKYPTQERTTGRGKEAKSDSEDGEERRGRKKKEYKGRVDSRGRAVEVRDYWAEVFLEREGRWVAVDVVTGAVDRAGEVQGRCSKPMVYVLAAEEGRVAEVTPRYAADYHTVTRKLRAAPAWVDATLAPYSGGQGERERKERTELAKKSGGAPLPTSVGQFKDHPLYALTRHLLKFEAIFPPDAPTLGFIKGEPVFARECVKTLQGRTAWLKEGRVVRLGQTPYKTVRARPKYDRSTGVKVAEEQLEVFGAWQTELYVAPAARDGKVPRNEYGNVELFKPWMLPAGTVHIPIQGMKAVVRKTGIDAAPAMVGWEFSGGGAHPVYDGVVVCQENAEVLMDAWNQEQEVQARRAEEKREKRVLDNWKRLIRGLVNKQRIMAKYMKK